MLFGFYTCNEALSRLDDYLDRELSPREIELVARHLKICRHCAEKFAFEAAFVADLREKLRHLDAPPHLLNQIRAALPVADSPLPLNSGDANFLDPRA